MEFISINLFSDQDKCRFKFVLKNLFEWKSIRMKINSIENLVTNHITMKRMKLAKNIQIYTTYFQNFRVSMILRKFRKLKIYIFKKNPQLIFFLDNPHSPTTIDRSGLCNSINNLAEAVPGPNTNIDSRLDMPKLWILNMKTKGTRLGIKGIINSLTNDCVVNSLTAIIWLCVRRTSLSQYC